MANFLHGVEVLEVNSGARPIRTVTSAVIGLVGSAPGDGAAATLELGSGNGKLKFSALTPGAAGNGYQIRAINPGTNSSALAVTIAAKLITISLATDGSGVATSTAAQVRTAFNAAAAVNALFSCALGDGSSGATLYAAHAAIALTGGLDDTFPLDKPVLLLPNTPGLATMLGGSDNFLFRAVTQIFKQTGALIVIVRTDDPVGDVTAFTGIYALKAAQSRLGYTPRILVMEGAYDDGIDDLKSVAASLKALTWVGAAPGSTATEARTWITANANERVSLVWPTVNGGDDPAPIAAGREARSDNELGFWWSTSNQEVFGVDELDSPVDFELGDPTSLANVLNEGNVTTFIQLGGFRLWGNRTGSIDPRWQFRCVRRTADIINQSIQRGHLWAVDRPMSKTYFQDVPESVNAYMRSLINLGAIIGGTCWADPEANNLNEIPNGHVTFVYDYTPTYPSERVTFNSKITNDYLVDLI